MLDEPNLPHRTVLDLLDHAYTLHARVRAYQFDPKSVDVHTHVDVGDIGDDAEGLSGLYFDDQGLSLCCLVDGRWDFSGRLVGAPSEVTVACALPNRMWDRPDFLEFPISDPKDAVAAGEGPAAGELRTLATFMLAHVLPELADEIADDINSTRAFRGS